MGEERREEKEEGKGGQGIEGEGRCGHQLIQQTVSVLQFCILECDLKCISPSGYHFGCRGTQLCASTEHPYAYSSQW